MIQWMLAVWSLVPLPFLNPACTSGNSWFTYCWSLAWRILSISHASKVMLKILQVRFQQSMNWEFPDVQAGFRKMRGNRNQIANTHWIMEKQGSSRKMYTSASLTTWKPLTVWITTNCGKFLEMEIPDHLICLLRNLYAGQEATVRTSHGTTGSNWESTTRL